AAILLVGIDVGQQPYFPHLLEQDRAPLHQVLHVVALNRVLKLRAASSSADAEVLRGLHKGVCAWDGKQFRTQTINDLAGGCVALFKRLQTHEDEAAIGGTAAARKRHGVGDARICFDNIDDARRSLLHGLKGSVLRALDAAEDDAVILLRKKSFGDDPKKVEVERDGQTENDQGQTRVFQNPTQAALVGSQKRLERALAGAVGVAVLLIPNVLEEARTHHRCRG